MVAEGDKEPDSGGAQPAGPLSVFLCHNSRDKRVVQDVAEGLELEFGIPHFLDAYAIPPGEAFLPWIESALASSTGCAIFLGANGWNPTHLWEAERALARYRQDPKFRLIPVALPGIREEDQRRLGAGSLFSEINWADFRNGSVDPVAIAKLRAALLGQPLEQGRAPSQLTPYLIRRDADRWHQSTGRNKSILYRGRQLTEARALQSSQPDLMAGQAIDTFLSASAAAQTRRFRTLMIVAIAVAISIGALAVQREMSRRLALSRFVAAEARQAAGADMGLLMAVQATHISPTAEAFGALIERLDAQPYLRQMIRVGEPAVRSLAFAPGATALYAGDAKGGLARIDLGTLSATQLPRATEGAVLSLDVDSDEKELWAGLEDGRVMVYGPMQSPYAVPGIAQISSDNLAAEVNRIKLGDAILSLQIDPTRRFVAAGDHGRRLVLMDRARRAVIWTKQLSAQRVTCVSFSVDGSLLAAGSSEGLVEIFEVPSGQPAWTVTTARTGNPMALQFARNGDLRVIDDGLNFSVYRRTAIIGEPEHIEGKFLSAAAVGPRREYGPVLRRGLLALGFASGDVLFTPALGEERKVSVAGHARAVNASALSSDGSLAATAADDGSVGIWDLTQRSRLIQQRSPPGGEVRALGYDANNRLLAVTTSTDTAALNERPVEGWKVSADLLALSRLHAGASGTATPVAVPNAEGFVPVTEPILTQAAFDATASHVAWVTRAGAVLWSLTSTTQEALLLSKEMKEIQALALSASGRYVFIGQADGSVICYDAVLPSAEPRRYKAPAAIRELVAGLDDASVIAAVDDGTVRRVDFAQAPPRDTLSVALAGTAGQLAGLPGTDTIVAGAAGATAGVDVGLITAGKYQRLYTRRLGGAAGAIAISRSARLIAVGDLDGRLHLWDLDTRLTMASLQIHSRAVNKLAISADGNRLAISAGGGDILELSLDRERWRKAACDVVRRELTPVEWRALLPGASLQPGCGEEQSSANVLEWIDPLVGVL